MKLCLWCCYIFCNITKFKDFSDLICSFRNWSQVWVLTLKSTAESTAAAAEMRFFTLTGAWKKKMCTKYQVRMLAWESTSFLKIFFSAVYRQRRELERPVAGHRFHGKFSGGELETYVITEEMENEFKGEVSFIQIDKIQYFNLTTLRAPTWKSAELE